MYQLIVELDRPHSGTVIALTIFGREHDLRARPATHIRLRLASKIR